MSLRYRSHLEYFVVVIVVVFVSGIAAMPQMTIKLNVPIMAFVCSL
jgi:hypothetical protein